MAAATLITPSDCSPHPWMQFAFQEFGQRELGGASVNNPRILMYLATCGRFTNDETAWCSAFANWCMREGGLTGTGRANARSWLTWGSALREPTYGCVVVLWREDPSSAKGHVGFYCGMERAGMVLLGGNQNHQVGFKNYSKGRVLGYRWPRGLAVPA